MKTPFLTFERQDTPNHTTLLFMVWSATVPDMLLGTIKWRSGWRRYVFYPQDGTVFDAACLTEIITFITNLMLDRWPEAKYNPTFGDERICTCGHVYYRHFDSYENMTPIGCKYCQCSNFKESKTRKVPK